MASKAFEEKVSLAYQCSIEEEYADVSTSTDAHTSFLALTSTTRNQTIEMSIHGRLCVDYVRGLLRVGDNFSFPKDMFEPVRDGLWNGSVDDQDPIGSCLAVVDPPRGGCRARRPCDLFLCREQ